MDNAKGSKNMPAEGELCEGVPQTPESSVAAEPAEEKTVMQVKSEHGLITIYADFAALKDAIVQGRVLKGMLLRVVKESDRDREDDVAGGSWQRIEELAKGYPELDVLYRPIWTTAKKFILYGIMTCVALKTLDTTILFFEASPALGIAWLITIGSMFIKKWWGPAFAIYFSVKAGIAVNLFAAALGVGVVGALFGTPLGMLIGTAAGYWKSRHGTLACDAVAEGYQPWICGLALPLVALVSLSWFYFVWLVPKMAEWLA